MRGYTSVDPIIAAAQLRALRLELADALNSIEFLRRENATLRGQRLAVDAPEPEEATPTPPARCCSSCANAGRSRREVCCMTCKDFSNWTPGYVHKSRDCP